MKKVSILLVALAVSITAFGQKEIKLDYVEVTGTKNKPINITYLSETQGGILSERVKDMQHKVASFNLKRSALYKERTSIYNVDFVGDKSLIIAKFARNGKLIETNERFKNVIFSVAVRNAIFKNNQGWQVVKNLYLVEYSDKNLPSRKYKVWLEKEGKIRKVMMDASGDFLAWVD